MPEIEYTKTCWSCNGTGENTEPDLTINGISLKKGPRCEYCNGTGQIDKDPSEIASEEGFTGTLPDFVSWLGQHLAYGGIKYREVPSEFRADKTEIEVRTWTGGFSSDEHLLGRVHMSIFMAMRWYSSHRGGEIVYRFSEAKWHSPKHTEWLAPEADESTVNYPRVGEVTIRDAAGVLHTFDGFEHGIALTFSDPTASAVTDGALEIQPLAQSGPAT